MKNLPNIRNYTQILSEIESFIYKIIEYIFLCWSQISSLACGLGGIIFQEILKFDVKYIYWNQ